MCMAARAKDGLDLIMSGKKLLGLFWRFESSHDLFSSSGGAVRSFRSIVETFMAAVLDAQSEVFQGGPVASKFVRDNNSRLAKGLEQFAEEPICGVAE